MWESISANALMAYTIIARTFSPRPWPVLDVLLVAMLVTLALYGALTMRRRIAATIVFLGLYAGVVLVWPFPPVRFIANLWSLLLLLSMAGLHTMWRRVRDHRARPRWVFAPIAAASLLGGCLAWQTASGYHDKAWSSLAETQASRIEPKLSWLARYSRPRDVVAAEDEPAVFLYTGRQAVPAGTFTGMQHVAPRTAAEDAAALRAIMRLYRPSLVLVGTPGPLEGAALLAKSSGTGLRYLGEIRASRVYVPVADAPNHASPAMASP